MTSLGSSSADMAVIVPAAGAGLRLGPGVPKALRSLRGEPLLAHAVRRVAAASAVGCLVVAAPPGEEAAMRNLLDQALPGGQERTRRSAGRVAASADDRPALRVEVVTGGAERQRSVAAALAALPAGFDIVLVHDAARALAPAALVDSVAAGVRGGWDAVIPVLPVTDTVTQVDPSGVSRGHLERSALRAVQTPQGFRRSVLTAAHAAADSDAAATDDAGLVARLGVPVHAVPGSPHAFKVTTSDDLAYAEWLLAGPAGGL